MNWKKVFILFVLSVFVTGICVGGVSATKNADGSATLKFHVDSQSGADNTIKLSAAEVKDIQNGKKVAKKIAVDNVPAKKKLVKVKVKDKVPVYKYKTKKVTKTKHVYVLTKTCSKKTFDKNIRKYKQIPGLSFKNFKVYYHWTYKTTVTKKVKYVHHYKTVYRTGYEYKVSGKKTVYRTAYIHKDDCYTTKNYFLTCNYNNYGNSFDIKFDLNFNYRSQFWF